MLKPLKIIVIISIVIVSLGILSLYFFYDPSVSTFFPKCLFYTLTNLHCPGCGTQRALHAIFSGNFIDGFMHNPLLLILAIVLVYYLFFSITTFYFNKNYQNLLYKPIVTKIILVIIILFWVLRNINYYPFTLLAP